MKPIDRIALACRIRTKAVKVAKVNNLDCWCAICSVALAMAFRKHKFKASVHFGTMNDRDHCWVQSDGVIYDITASQFGYPNIFVVSVKNLNEWTISCCNCGKECDKLYQSQKMIDKFGNWTTINQFFHDWPIEQKPTPTNIKQICKGIA